MINKKILFGQKVREKILSGILKVGKAAAATYGPKGRISVQWNGAQIFTTKDGIKTIQKITFGDELENIGASLIKEACSKANYQSGDGSTCTGILTYLLCKKANDLLNTGIDINTLKEGYDIALDHTVRLIQNYKIPIKDEQDLYNIAKVSANGDDEIAANITKAFSSIGEDGIVSISDSLSRQGKSEVVFYTGCDFDKGFISSKCVNTKNDTCELEDPLILLSRNSFNKFEEIVPYIQYANSVEMPIVIIAPDFDETCSAGFYDNVTKNRIKGSLIFAPGISKEAIHERLRDLAVLLNAQILGEDVDEEKYDLNVHSGSCEKIIIHKNKTEIINPKTNEQRFQDYIKILKAKIDLDDANEAYTEFEIESIKERIAHMVGGVAVIKVGALTQMDLDEKKDRYEDAISAVKAAIKEGIVPGAGTTLLRIGTELYATKAYNKEIEKVIKAFCDAITEPAKILIRSAGNLPEKIIPTILKKKNYGYDSRSEKVVDLLFAGIIDPAKVIRNAITYATNVAKMFASIDVAVISDLKNVSIDPLDPLLVDDIIKEL